MDEWLEAFLDGREKPSAEAVEAGKAAGFSEKQLKTSRARIGVLVRRTDEMPSRTFWRLGGDGDGQDETPEACSMDENMADQDCQDAPERIEADPVAIPAIVEPAAAPVAPPAQPLAKAPLFI